MYAQNIEMTKLTDIWSPTWKILCSGLLLLIVARLIFRSWVKAGILVSIISLLFFNFGVYHNYLYNYYIPYPIKNIRLDHNFYKWSSLIILVITCWFLMKKKSTPTKLNSLLNFVSVILIGISLYNIASFHLSKNQTFDSPKYIQVEPAFTATIQKPSIYYLIMDAYASSDVLKNYYGFDNTDFLKFLKDKGFFVANKSHSNYAQTILSIPSSLNMTYLDSVAKTVGTENEDRWPLKKFLDNNKVLKYLKSIGYMSAAFDGAIWDLAYLNNADLFYSTPGSSINMLENELLKISVLNAFKNGKLLKTEPYAHHRKKILNAFDKIIQMSKRKEPYYIHGHVLAPHEPFVFDKNGKPVNPDHDYSIWRPFDLKSDNSYFKKAYIEQLQFVNKKLKETINSILENSTVKPIIIIQGDHGPSSELRNYKGFANNDFTERMSILNAYYFPDGDYSQLYDSISPVNSFRVIMNKYFGTGYSLLPDRSYFSNWDRPYHFYEVTDSLKSW
jgi:hypothetical protein